MAHGSVHNKCSWLFKKKREKKRKGGWGGAKQRRKSWTRIFPDTVINHARKGPRGLTARRSSRAAVQEMAQTWKDLRLTVEHQCSVIPVENGVYTQTTLLYLSVLRHIRAGHATCLRHTLPIIKPQDPRVSGQGTFSGEKKKKIMTG